MFHRTMITFLLHAFKFAKVFFSGIFLVKERNLQNDSLVVSVNLFAGHVQRNLTNLPLTSNP